MSKGRPKQYANRVVMSIRLDAELRKRLKIEAIRRDVSANLLFDRAVRTWLEKNEGKG